MGALSLEITRLVGALHDSVIPGVCEAGKNERLRRKGGDILETQLKSCQFNKKFI